MNNATTQAHFSKMTAKKRNHPDYKGGCMVGGVEMWMSAWLKTGANGTKFMSFSFQPKDQQQAQARQTLPRQTSQAETMLDDDLPF